MKLTTEMVHKWAKPGQRLDNCPNCGVKSNHKIPIGEGYILYCDKCDLEWGSISSMAVELT